MNSHGDTLLPNRPKIVEDGAAPAPDAIRAVVSEPRIAFVHEWYVTYAGSEKVLEAMLEEFPSAELYCLIDCLKPEDRERIAGRRPRTSFLQHVPFVHRLYPYLLFLMPFAVEQHDLSKFDIIVSNSHAVAKGIIVGADQLHICYCYSPMRYAWELQEQYLREAGLHRGPAALFARIVMHFMRIWDVRTSFSVDRFIACSAYIARRIEKTYRRSSTVIYPNVAVEAFTIGAERGDFYLTASRLTPYKRVLVIVEAFARMPDRKLVVIGAGPQFRRIVEAAPPNVTVLGYQDFRSLRSHMQRAKAFIFAAEEDFGITPLEAQACGTPVLAFSKGGASETVVPGLTGLHFHEQTAEAVRDAVERFESLPSPLSPQTIRAHALRFSTERFKAEFHDFVDAAWREHRSRIAASQRLDRTSTRDRA